MSSITKVKPTSFSKAFKHPQWMDDMTEEYRALIANGTWELVPSPFTQNVVGCKWAYKIKYCSNGGIERYKPQLVAQDFHQQARID